MNRDHSPITHDYTEETILNEPRIDLYFTSAAISNERLKGYTAVVIDVLRAATSIAVALKNGAKDVIPADTSASVMDIASGMNREDILLCGERDGKMVEGFNLGNSPSEFTREKVRGRRLIFGSANGTPAVIRAAVARQVFLGSFVNMDAVIDAVLSSEEPFPLAIVCAGKQDTFALEDALCGGMLLERISQRQPSSLAGNDAARAAEALTREFGGDVLSVLRNCDHGRYLTSIGFDEDLIFCAQDSVVTNVPHLLEGRLVSLEEKV